MTKTFGSTAKVKMDRPDRLNRRATEKDIDHILRMILEIRPLWDDAVEGGVWSPRTDGMGRPSTRPHPTEAAVFSPTRRQLREAAKEAASLIGEARQHLEIAAEVLHRGLLRQDPEVLSQFLEKRGAATQRP